MARTIYDVPKMKPANCIAYSNRTTTQQLKPPYYILQNFWHSLVFHFRGEWNRGKWFNGSLLLHTKTNYLNYLWWANENEMNK